MCEWVYVGGRESWGSAEGIGSGSRCVCLMSSCKERETETEEKKREREIFSKDFVLLNSVSLPCFLHTFCKKTELIFSLCQGI